MANYSLMLDKTESKRDTTQETSFCSLLGKRLVISYNEVRFSVRKTPENNNNAECLAWLLFVLYLFSGRI